MIERGRLGFSFFRIVSAHVALLNQPLDPGRKRRNLKRESNKANNFLHQLQMSNRLLCLEGLDYSRVNEKLTVCENALMHAFTVLLALFLLN